ncbi:phytoene desaturase family protein [Aureispira]|nr:phytoene desaturase family protein [Aureispira sp.]
MYDAIIIGGGLAGIAISLRLRNRGAKVLVLEKNSYVGGKINQLDLKGYRFDTGPSLFTMPELVNELYQLYEEDYSQYYNYHQHSESCRYFFNDGQQINFFTNPILLEQELASKLGVDSSCIEKYLDHSAKKYETIGKLFMETAIHKNTEIPWKSIFLNIPAFLNSGLLTTLNKLNTKALKNDKLVQIFNRFATYNGSDPYKASGILSMIPHLEQNLGTFFPVGGISNIINGLYKLALKNGVQFRLNEDISNCNFHKGNYTIEANHNYKSTHLICAIDHLSFYKNILKDQDLYQKYQKQERSTSAIVFYWGINKSFEKLGLHNIFFSNDYPEEFKEIALPNGIPSDPTIYVHISSKLNKKDAPEGCENWFVMINVAAGVIINQSQEHKIKELIINKLEHTLTTDIRKHIVTEKVWTPEKIELDTGSFSGALYGAASNKKFSALSRHPNFSKKYKNLYFCGGTVHPGGGIPLVLQSAGIVDKLIADVN